MYRMEGVREFLESSTIHGLVYISTTRTLSRLFWILTVTSGFLTAGVLVTRACREWRKNPTDATIETFPIHQVDFPDIIVCPPKVEWFFLLKYS